MQPCYLMPHGNDAETAKLPAYIMCDSMVGLYVTAYELQSRLVRSFSHALAACMHTSTHASMQVTLTVTGALNIHQQQ